MPTSPASPITAIGIPTSSSPCAIVVTPIGSTISCVNTVGDLDHRRAVAKTTGHQTKTDRADRCHANDGPQVTRIERSMPCQLVDRQANRGRRKPQRLNASSDNSNKQRDGEGLRLGYLGP